MSETYDEELDRRRQLLRWAQTQPEPGVLKVRLQTIPDADLALLAHEVGEMRRRLPVRRGLFLLTSRLEHGLRTELDARQIEWRYLVANSLADVDTPPEDEEGEA